MRRTQERPGNYKYNAGSNKDCDERKSGGKGGGREDGRGI